MNDITENFSRMSVYEGISFGFIAENTADLVEVLDSRGKRIFMNASCAAILGDPGKLIGTYPGDDRTLDDAANMQKLIVDVINKGTARCEEFRRTLSDGSSRYLETRASPVRDDKGRTRYIYMVSRDITEHVHARELLRNCETRLKAAQEIGMMGGWEYDYATETLFMSDKFSVIFGLPSHISSLKKAEIMDLIHPEDRDKMSGLKIEQSVGESIYETQYRIVRRDSSERVILSRWQVDRDDKGLPCRSTGFCQDVTEQVEMAKSALSIEEHFQLLVEHTEDFAIFLLDLDGYVTSWNRGAERVYGYQADEVLGRHYSCFCPPERTDRDTFSRQLQTAARDGRYETEDLRVRKNDDRFRAHVIITPLLNKAGKLSGYLKIVHDKTKQKCTEDILRSQAERQKVNARRLVELQESERQHLARELHDLVGPNLTALGINLQLITSRLSQGSRDEVSEVLGRSVENVHSMVETLRYIIGELRPHTLDDFGLRAGLRSHVAQFMKLTGIKVNIHETNTPEQLPDFIKLSLFRITQEALNNVAKHSKATRAEISIVYGPGKIDLCIADNGIGFDLGRTAVNDPPKGVGLVIMRERAEAIGASFDLQTAAGQGVRLRLECNIHSANQ